MPTLIVLIIVGFLAQLVDGAPQQALNMAASSDLTNVANGGVARIFVPTGANLKRTVWEDGAEIYEADQKPEAFNTYLTELFAQ